jgi:hypothetical protein
MRPTIHHHIGTPGIRIEPIDTVSTALCVDCGATTVRMELTDREIEWLVDQLHRARTARAMACG